MNRWKKKVALGAALLPAFAAAFFSFSTAPDEVPAAPETQSRPAPAPLQGSPSASAPSGIAASAPPPPGRSIADILESYDLADPTQRERAVAEIRELETERRSAGLARTRELGLPARVQLPDGTVREIAGLDDRGNPLYFTTHNANAAISTGSNLLRLSPYNLTSGNLTIGMWDGGSGRATHQEFGGRLVVRDGSASIDHATHVGGTLAASGVFASARGMATAALIDSYDWNSDKTEMTAAGAAQPRESGKILLSNHSYGFLTGWAYVNGGSPYRVWEWFGDGTTANGYDFDFGRYNTQARDSDSLAYNLPYYLVFRSAGNKRTDNPSSGQSVALSPGSSTVVTYDSSLHPKGDGTYRAGYETIGYDALAKNVITIGSVTDAVTSGLRDPSKANSSSFSSWGPTDDGRIKPDLVANGDGVYSPLNGSNSAYGTLSGTSMSSPNAAGTAAQLVEEYRRLFPGSDMRSSTLKALLLHTADDRGNPGPDYTFGWGLLNGKAAADLLRDHEANPIKKRLAEDKVTSSRPSITTEFVWDGVSPIRATLVWTDPAGTATTTNDLRSARLRHNLDLKILAPDGNTHLPWVMPFVGQWTPESMSQPATRSINNTDNVEQVLIATPSPPGTYRAVVSYQGTLSADQFYSLLIDGSAAEEPPPPPLTVESVSPASAVAGANATLELTGLSLAQATSVRLVRDSFAEIVASNLRMSGEKLLADLNLAGAQPGLWSVRAASANTTSTLPDAFTVIGAIWSENFDGTITGWTSNATTGSNSWSISSNRSHTAPNSYFIAAPASKTTTRLASPAISIPANATDLQLKFRHSYNLENLQDGGRLAYSINGTAWVFTDDTNSGVSFASNGYSGTIRATGNPNGRSEFNGKKAWTGNSGTFIETILNLNDTAKFTGKTVRFAWVMATNSTTASPGWFVDSILLTGGGDLDNQPPSITSPADTASTESVSVTIGEDTTIYEIVRSDSVDASVAATDDAGAEGLVYTWTAAGPTPVFFLPNASNASANSTASFEALGDYILTVTVRDAAGLEASSRVSVRVLAAAAALEVSPESASLTIGATVAFTAKVLDQFTDEMSTQPATFEWATSGGGTIDSLGLFTATTAGENFSVIATSNPLSKTALVTVTPPPLTAFQSWLLENFGENFADNPDAQSAADPDRDGTPNLAEFHLGTDPNDPASKLECRIVARHAETLEIEISPAVPIGQYRVRTTDSLESGWTGFRDLTVESAADPAKFEIPATGDRLFLRLDYEPPTEN